MKHDDYLKQVTSKLDGLAQQHKDKAAVMNHVLAHIEEKKTARYGLWKMSGFAFAAAIAGIAVLPQTPVLHEVHRPNQSISPKLSPQMVEDLEMLMLLADEQAQHGS